MTLITLATKVISPFHDTEKAWEDAKSEQVKTGAPAYLSAGFIGSVVVLAAAVAAAFNYPLTKEQIEFLQANIYNLVNAVAGIYGVAMVISNTYFKKKG